jgi:hypothetical protein
MILGSVGWFNHRDLPICVNITAYHHLGSTGTVFKAMICRDVTAHR